MKVVLFCGGLGTRLREYSESIPKPMVPIGTRPVLWHVMKYYAHFGHREFILCLGYRGDVIEQYFRDGDESLSNDRWKITFVDTGLHANVGQRLKAVERCLGDDEVFLANYADGLSDLSLPDYLEHFRQRRRIASFLCVRPSQSFHVVSASEAGLVHDIQHVGQAGLWINGGFFAFKREIFEYLGAGEELMEQPFQRLIAEGQLIAYRYDGFWQCMDTFKDKQQLDDMKARGNPPWEVWKRRVEGPLAASGPPGGRSGLTPDGTGEISRPAGPDPRVIRR